MEKIQITTKGIRKSLQRFDYLQSIAEYIWNGFDARATVVKVKLLRNELDGIDGLVIEDNGYGIKRNELDKKFTPFFESEKQIDPNKKDRSSSVTHGKNGIGRLTFHRFCSYAEWKTTYKNELLYESYTITVEGDKLDSYNVSDTQFTEELTGTTVTLKNIFENISIQDILQHLSKEFGWFLELNQDKGYELFIDNILIDYSSIIGDRDTYQLVIGANKFDIKYIRWNDRINNEYSRFYYLNGKKWEIYKQTTSLNNKGDSFYHSVYIQSDYFNDFDFNHNSNSNQLTLKFSASYDDNTYIELMEKINKHLFNKRKPFLEKHSELIVEDLRLSNAFPKYHDNPWDKMRREELEQVVRGIYHVEPKVFSKLNNEQKKTLVRLLDLIMDSGERNRLFDILQDIIELDQHERTELAVLLKSTHMSSVIKTIKLIQDRYKAIDELKSLVFNDDLLTNERDHIQKFVERHYWVFGEQYHLVTAAEPKFEEALRRFTHILTGDKVDGKIDHPDKRKEMDIFMVRWDKGIDEISNIVVELKHPSITLGNKEFDQVRKYMDVIIKQEEFNGKNMNWEFTLVGNKINDSIEGYYESARPHGERYLAFKRDRYKIYVKTWSDIFSEFEIKHKFLDDKLQLERSQLSNDFESADELIAVAEENTASMPGQFTIPKISN